MKKAGYSIILPFNYLLAIFRRISLLSAILAISLIVITLPPF